MRMMKVQVKCLRVMSNRKTLPLPLPLKERGVVTIVLLLFCLSGMAQDGDDFGFDLSAGVEKKISKAVSFEVDANFRTQNDTKNVERWGIGGAFGFKLINTKKFDLKASAGWEYIWQNRPGEESWKYETYDQNTPSGIVHHSDATVKVTYPYWRNRHRTSVGLSASYKPSKRWEFSLKEMVQYNHYCKAEVQVDEYEIEDSWADVPTIFNPNDKNTTVTSKFPIKDAKDRFVLRSKLAAQYNIRHCPLSPYASVDYGAGLNYSANKWKFSVGTDIALSKQHKLDVFYRFQTEDDDDEPNGHIIGVGYKFKF